MRVAAIVNPAAGLGKAGKKWPDLLGFLGSAAAQMETFWSKYPGHSESLAALVKHSGFDRVLAVGGDGTLFEILNGLWWNGGGELPSVGMVPLGTGCDYIRNFEVGRSLVEKLRTAVGPSTVRVSLGHCSTQNSEGVGERVFAMILGLGFDAEVVRLYRTGRFGKAGWRAYALSTLSSFGRLRSHFLSGNIDGSLFHAEAISFGAALGRCFGRRIEIAPPASPARDEFEVVWAERIGFSRMLFMVSLAYFGAHYRLPWVKTGKAGNVCLDSSPPAWIEADGELIGKTPVEIQIIPGAFSFAAKAVRRRPEFPPRHLYK